MQQIQNGEKDCTSYVLLHVMCYLLQIMQQKNVLLLCGFDMPFPISHTQNVCAHCCRTRAPHCLPPCPRPKL